MLIHVPAGAVPGDGPSAGVAMFTALASRFNDRPVRPDAAMIAKSASAALEVPVSAK